MARTMVLKVLNQEENGGGMNCFRLYNRIHDYYYCKNNVAYEENPFDIPNLN
jgi:hypothetical protein